MKTLLGLIALLATSQVYATPCYPSVTLDFFYANDHFTNWTTALENEAICKLK